MEKAIRVALYARVSRLEQVLENQLLILKAEVERHKDWVVVGTYADKASGANQKRPGLDAMLNDCRAHKIDIIVAIKLDRLARSVVNLSNMCKELEELEPPVGIKLVEQPIDTTNAMGRFMRTVLAAVAEIELENIHERTRDGLARAKAEGKRLGRPPTALSDYQLQKARELLQKNPLMTQREMAANFKGVGRNQLIRELRKAGIWIERGDRNARDLSPEKRFA